MYDIFSLMERKKEAPALRSDQGECISYGELQDRIRKMQSAFLSLKEKTERTICFCMCRNRPGAVVGYLGMLYSGMVPLLLDEQLKEGQLRQFYETYEPAFFWAPVEWIRQWSGRLAFGDVLFEADGYCLVRTEKTPCEVYADLALLLATSGSTGNPKLVRISRENLRSNAKAIAEYLGLDERERPITTLPMQYTYGLSILNSHLLSGACILMTTASYVQSGFWKFLEEQQATSFGGVPYTYELLRKIHIFDKKIPSLRMITQAGGHLNPELQKLVGTWAAEQGIQFFVMYGQTEATARMSYLPPERVLEKAGSIGMAIPGGRFELWNESNAVIDEPEAVGELVYYGPNVTLGYADKKSDLSLPDTRMGCLVTGDMAKRDADGYYYIVGRKKRFLKLFGVRVSLDTCEDLLRSARPGQEFACAGADDCLKIYSLQDEDAEWAVDYLSEYLHIHRKAFSGVCLEEIPKNSSGKIQYQLLP